MTAQVHDHSIEKPRQLADGRVTGGRLRQVTSSRWLLPGLAAGLLAAGLLAAGVPLLTMVYIGLIGGMVLMHAGGHGAHGGHGAPTPRAGAGGAAPGGEDLGHGSHGSQPGGQGSAQVAQDRPASGPNANEEHKPDQHASHGCH